MNYRHGWSRRPEYFVWQTIKSRCSLKTNKSYKDYGGRGIKMCDEWRADFKNFIDDMGARPSDMHEIDRIDNDGDYTPENCRWVTRAEQANNKQNTVRYQGKTIREWAEKLDIYYSTFRQRAVDYGLKSAIEYYSKLDKPRRPYEPLVLKPRKPKALKNE